MKAAPAFGLDTPAFYRVRLQGNLDPVRLEWLGGMTIAVEQSAQGSAVTVITGLFVDQAALSGLLNFAYDLGYPLLSVECLGEAGPSQPGAAGAQA